MRVPSLDDERGRGSRCRCDQDQAERDAESQRLKFHDLARDLEWGRQSAEYRCRAKEVYSRIELPAIKIVHGYIYPRIREKLNAYWANHASAVPAPSVISCWSGFSQGTP